MIKKENMQVGMKFSGEYRLQIFAQDGSEKTDTGFFDNLLTDTYFNRWIGGVDLSGRAGLSFCGVGSGTAAPTVGDTTITSVGSRAAAFSYSITTSGLTNTTTIQFRFPVNAVIGTIAEVGLFGALSGGNLGSRALIKDVGGVPTSLTLVTGDTLYVTWRGNCTISASDVTGVTSIGGVNYNYAMRPCNFSTWGSGNDGQFGSFVLAGTRNGHSDCFGFSIASAYATQALGPNTGRPSGTGFPAADFPTLSAYSSGTFARTLTYTLGPANGNTGSGIGSLTFASTSAGFQISFSAVSGGSRIPKDATKTLTIPLTLVFGR